jgi:hypothetical protein
MDRLIFSILKSAIKVMDILIFSILKDCHLKLWIG